MKSREIFKIIVATLGLIGILYGTIYAVDGLLLALGLNQQSNYPPQIYIVKGLIQIVIGALIMKGFPPFVNFAFPPDKENKPDENKEEE
jgi:hypothetical protein